MESNMSHSKFLKRKGRYTRAFCKKFLGCCFGLRGHVSSLDFLPRHEIKILRETQNMLNCSIHILLADPWIFTEASLSSRKTHDTTKIVAVRVFCAALASTVSYSKDGFLFRTCSENEKMQVRLGGVTKAVWLTTLSYDSFPYVVSK